MNGNDIPFQKYEPVARKEKRERDSSKQKNTSPKNKIKRVSPSTSESAVSNTVDGLESSPASTYFCCDFKGCNYQAKDINHVKMHKEYMHEPNKPWHFCGQSGCEFRSKTSGEIDSHRLIVHGIIEETEGLPDFDVEDEKGTNKGLKDGKAGDIEELVGQPAPDPIPPPPPVEFVPHFTSGAITDDVIDQKNCIPGRLIKI